MTDTRPTDSEIAAQWSIQATQDGRYELAEAVLRIAMQAFRTEKAPSPRPAYAGEPAAAARQVPKLMAVPTVHANGLVPAPVATAVISMGELQTELTRDNRRCEASSLNNGNGFEIDCHAGVYWDHQNHVWKHIDAELDKDHYPAVREG